MTPEKIAAHIANRFEGMKVVADFFCGPGGNCIQFGLKDSVETVIGIDNNPEQLRMFRKNSAVYGVDSKMRFVHGDVYEVAPLIKDMVKIDAIFMSPPWGGPDYQRQKRFDVSIFKHPVELARSITENVCILVPRNIDFQNVYDTFGECEIEDNYLERKLKTRSIYFGDIMKSAPSQVKRPVEMGNSTLVQHLKAATGTHP